MVYRHPGTNLLLNNNCVCTTWLLCCVCGMCVSVCESCNDGCMLGVNHEELVSLAEKHFANLSSSNEHVDIAPCRYTGSEVCLHCMFLLVWSLCKGQDP